MPLRTTHALPPATTMLLGRPCSFNAFVGTAASPCWLVVVVRAPVVCPPSPLPPLHPFRRPGGAALLFGRRRARAGVLPAAPPPAAAVEHEHRDPRQRGDRHDRERPRPQPPPRPRRPGDRGRGLIGRDDGLL